MKLSIPLLRWVNIPAGKVTLSAGGYLHEPTIFDVSTFKIAKYPVTVAQYDLFIQDGGYTTDRWWNGLAKRIEYPEELPSFSKANHPRVNVTWYESMAFCRWLSDRMAKNIYLPSEQQWQRAAQGDDNRLFPWGDEFDERGERRCNSTRYASYTYGTTSVRAYVGKGNSPFGVSDMCGNVGEWCLTAYETGEVGTTSEAKRSLRGGSWHSLDMYELYVTDRYYWNPEIAMDFWGFRVTCS